MDPDRFARLGIARELDLILHLPIRYEDLTRITPIAALRDSEHAQIEGEVVRSDLRSGPRRSLLVELDDGTGRILFRFFHFYGSQVRQLARGQRIRAAGEVRASLLGLEMVHPQYRIAKPGLALADRLTPVYSTVSGVSQVQLRRAIAKALADVSLAEFLPAVFLEQHGLMRIDPALRLLHAPPPDIADTALLEKSHPAWRRVVFDELLAQQISLRRARAARGSLKAPALREQDLVRRLLGILPFELTGAQARAWEQIHRDLAAATPMNRLLQGDVGSGKTVVAALAAVQAIGSGWQAAIMAPTEILAEQHARKLIPWFEALDVRVARLTGSMREREKRAIREALVAGDIDLLIGTHALIETAVDFDRLGLVIVDEQHRFGVAQRLRLTGKSNAHRPHQLMMSATPIPRTLAMTYYADLELTVVDELPPGRKPVLTRLLSDSRRDELIERVADATRAGRQVYWVCPLIEDTSESADPETSGNEAVAAQRTRPRASPLSARQQEALELQNAIETHRNLSLALAPIPVGLVHGRLPAASKRAVMDAFAGGEIQVLVATTVIEVGVDVPNASLMVIEHAERFGLAQLHQLRGRVGRGSAESACMLLYRSPLSVTARARLRTMAETNDGFEIARRDLLLRGPGEILGARQSGVPLLRFADLERDVALVELAREMAGELLSKNAAQADDLLNRWYGGREEFLRA